MKCIWIWHHLLMVPCRCKWAWVWLSGMSEFIGHEMQHMNSSSWNLIWIHNMNSWSWKISSWLNSLILNWSGFSFKSVSVREQSLLIQSNNDPFFAVSSLWVLRLLLCCCSLSCLKFHELYKSGQRPKKHHKLESNHQHPAHPAQHDISRIFSLIDRIFHWKALHFLVIRMKDFWNFVLGNCIFVFDAEQVYLKLQATNLKNKEVTVNPKPQTLEKNWFFENPKP